MEQENQKRELLRKKLREKINNKKSIRNPQNVKQDVVDDNLKNLGINNVNELKNYLQSIKDLDKNEIENSMKQFGITKDQLNQFYKKFNI